MGFHNVFAFWTNSCWNVRTLECHASRVHVSLRCWLLFAVASLNLMEGAENKYSFYNLLAGLIHQEGKKQNRIVLS